MATVSQAYGSQTAFVASSNLSAMPSNVVRAMGSVANTATLAVGYKIDTVINLCTTGVTSTGFVSFYLVESNDGGTTYTDGVNVTTSATLTNARLVYTAVASANSQILRLNFDLPSQIAPRVWSLCVSNGSGATFSNAAYAVNYTPTNVTVA